MILMKLPNNCMINPNQIVSIEPVDYHSDGRAGFNIILSRGKYPIVYETKEEAEAEYNKLLTNLTYDIP